MGVQFYFLNSMPCKRWITSEYVAHGHPDKLADFISDSILQEIYFQDWNARTGIETMVKNNTVVLGGEIKTTAKVDYETIVRDVFAKHVIYPENHHLLPDDIKIINLIGEQSPEISAMVDNETGIIGAGDQGFAVGYAINETPSYMPLGVYVAKSLCQRVGGTTYPTRRLGPDAKTQVVVGYDEERNPEINHILVSVLHTNQGLEETRKKVYNIINKNHYSMDNEIYDKYFKNGDIIVEVNPYGEWKTGGPIADCGLTGRKIVVDQYGGYCNVGGGAFSGKDMSKVDRSAAYMARYIAKNIVASGLCNEAKVVLSYIIGQANPCAFDIEMDTNCELIDDIKIFFYDRQGIDLTPDGIISYFGKHFNFPWYAKYGAFGYTDIEAQRLGFVPWELTDLASELRYFIEDNQ